MLCCSIYKLYFEISRIASNIFIDEQIMLDGNILLVILQENSTFV